MNPNQPPKKGPDVPSVQGEIKPESNPSVVTVGAEDDGLIEAIVTSQVILGQDRDKFGNVLTTGKVAKRGASIRVSREFFRIHRGEFVETPAEFARLEKKARGEEDF